MTEVFLIGFSLCGLAEVECTLCQWNGRAEGESVSQIAARLFLSVKTVSTYRRRILDKMTMKSNADITSYAIRNDLIR